MEVQKEIYVDGMPQIHFAGAMVRFDFATLQPDTTGNQGKPTPMKTQRLVMNLHGFLGMFDTMQKMIDRLLDAGILQKKVTEKLDD